MTNRRSKRIDAELTREGKHLRERTRKATTKVVSASMDAHFKHVVKRVRLAELLREFVGFAEGDPDLSSNYKAKLGRSP